MLNVNFCTKKTVIVIGASIVVLFFACCPAFAAALNLDTINDPLQSIIDILTGKTVKLIATILIIMGGIMIAVGESGGIFSLLAKIIIGIGLAVGAVNLVNAIWP